MLSISQVLPSGSVFATQPPGARMPRAWPLASHWRGSRWSSPQFLGTRLASMCSGGWVWLPAMTKIDLPSGESRRACGPCSPPPRNVASFSTLSYWSSPFGVGRAVEAAAGAAVDREVEVAEGVEHPLRGGDLDAEVLDLRRLVAADRRQGDPAEPLAVLVAGDQPPLVVEGDRDPRAEGLARHGEQLLDLEPRRDVEDPPRPLRRHARARRRRRPRGRRPSCRAS